MRTYEECRPYVEHLLAEHRRLHGLLRKSRAAIVQSGGPDRDATPEDIVRTLRFVRQELTEHFAQEEAGGCLDEAVSRCPRLAADAERITAEHGELLRSIESLSAKASECGRNTKERLAFEQAFDELCRQVHAHEAAENRLLREGFGVNLNGDEEPAEFSEY
jgi:hemerythrin